MRRILPLFAFALLAGCGGTSAPVAAPVPTAAAEREERGDLIGMESGALIARLGPPRLTVHEGDGTKLQFGGGSCMLDAYLYPPASGGAARVAHLDSRDRDGRSVDQPGCIASLTR